MSNPINIPLFKQNNTYHDYLNDLNVVTEEIDYRSCPSNFYLPYKYSNNTPFPCHSINQLFNVKTKYPIHEKIYSSKPEAKDFSLTDYMNVYMSSSSSDNEEEEDKTTNNEVNTNENKCKLYFSKDEVDIQHIDDYKDNDNDLDFPFTLIDFQNVANDLI